MFRKKEVDNVSNIYFSTISKLSSVIFQILSLTDKQPARFYINYGSDEKFEELASELKKVPLNEIESLCISDEQYESILSLTKCFLSADTDEASYRLTFAKSYDHTFEIELNLFEIAKQLGCLEYGYSRFLREDYSKISESKVKKGLFSISSSSLPHSITWLVNPELLSDGAFKGFYPLNYFNPKTLNLVKEHIGDIKLVSHSQNNCLFCIDELTQKELKKNRTLKKYLHFTST